MCIGVHRVSAPLSKLVRNEIGRPRPVCRDAVRAHRPCTRVCLAQNEVARLVRNSRQKTASFLRSTARCFATLPASVGPAHWQRLCRVARWGVGAAAIHCMHTSQSPGVASAASRQVEWTTTRNAIRLSPRSVLWQLAQSQKLKQKPRRTSTPPRLS